MKYVKCLSVWSLFILANIHLQAQTIDDICAKNVESLGGKEAVEKVKSLKITQVGTSQGKNMPMTTIMIPGKVYYQKVRTSMGILITCANGNEGWTYTTMPMPKTNTLPVNTAKSLLIDSKFYGPIYDYYVNGDESDVKEISIDGHLTIDREDCHKLNITYKSGYKISVYVSSLDNMIRKTETPAGIIKFKNYKKTSGVMIPRYVEITNINGTITATVSKVSINSNINNDIFTRP